MRYGGLRIGAVAIAAVAVVDPVFTMSRSSRPTVAIITADSAADASLANEVVRVLDRRFTVVRGRFDGAAATVIVGRAMPDEAPAVSGAIVAVLPDTPSPSVRVVSVDAPSATALDVRVPIRVVTSVQGARGRRLTLELRANGAVADHASQTVESDSGLIDLTVHHVPLSTGAQVLAVKAMIDDDVASDSSFTVVDARPGRYAVLFHDARPSWSSTFIRRTVELDARFSITHRVVTSRGLSNTGGAPPESLRDAATLSGFATIVVGAPETLTAADVHGLEMFMRQRGGSVVMLMDGANDGPFGRLTGVTAWRTSRTNAPAVFRESGGFASLQGRETSWPAVTPSGSTVHAVSVARDSTTRPIVWSVPVGAGRLVISGALDAWQFRGDSSGFNTFWTTLLARLAGDAPQPISVELSRSVLRPGETTLGRIAIRAPLLSGLTSRTAAVGAALVSERDSTVVRLWPEPTPGLFSASIVAPRQPGSYRLVVWTETERAESPVLVDDDARSPVRGDREVLESFVSSRGGSVVTEDALHELPDRLSSAIQVVSRVESWHPMRSPWWIVPFALLLGAEWWARRRRGLA